MCSSFFFLLMRSAHDPPSVARCNVLCVCKHLQTVAFKQQTKLAVSQSETPIPVRYSFYYPVPNSPRSKRLRFEYGFASPPEAVGELAHQRRGEGYCPKGNFPYGSPKKEKSTFSLLSLTEKCKHEISAENLFSLPICVIMGLTKSFPLRGRGTALAVEGACVTLDLY